MPYEFIDSSTSYDALFVADNDKDRFIDLMECLCQIMGPGASIIVEANGERDRTEPRCRFYVRSGLNTDDYTGFSDDDLDIIESIVAEFRPLALGEVYTDEDFVQTSLHINFTNDNDESARDRLSANIRFIELVSGLGYEPSAFSFLRS